MNIGFEELMTKVEWREIFCICDVFAVSTTMNYSMDLTLFFEERIFISFT